MATKFTFLALSLQLAAGSLAAQSTAFTYQGRLTDGTVPATGLYDFRFRAYDDPTNGYAVGSALNILAVPVTNGLFTVLLDLGSGAFDGKSLWLEIATKNTFTDNLPVVLSPRQQITPAPYAITAANLKSAGTAPMEIKVNGQRTLRLEAASVSPNVIGGNSVNLVGPGVSGATIGGGGAIDDGEGTPLLNQVTANFGTVSGGAGNTAQAEGSTISGGYKNLVGKGALYSVIGGGAENTNHGHYGTTSGGLGHSIGTDSSFSTIAGGERHRIADEAWNSTIGGGEINAIETQTDTATIAGGGYNRIGASADSATIGGGTRNAIGFDAEWATISGGGENLANGQSAVIGGGQNNVASANATTVGGGFANRASGAFSTVSGGRENVAYGELAVVPGGYANTATTNAFAAGSRAKARHSGAFLWADASSFDFNSSNGNEFAVRATGGSRFVSALDATGAPSTGVTLAPGSGSWSMLSDRNAKENFQPANAREVLEKLTELPVSRWSYKSQDKSVQHLGPVAQDFRAAFGLGENDTTISAVDAEGVALAAIQGLNQKLEERLKAKDAEIAALTTRLADLENLVRQLGRSPAAIVP